MSIASLIAALLIALLHIYIMVLECFLWTTPRGMRTFGLKPDFAKQSKSLAANQGLYNGFLAAALIWGAFHPTAEFGRQVVLFCCGCVFVAGVVGGVTAKPRIFLVQGVPGLVAGLVVWLF